MADSASTTQAHQRASTRWMCAATRSASLAWTTVEVVEICGAHWLEGATRKRRPSLARRPSASSTALRRTTRCPCQCRGGAWRVRPGFASSRGHETCCCPHASSACRTAHVRGTSVRSSTPCSRHTPACVDRRPSYRHHATDAFEPQGQACLDGNRRFCAVTRMAIAKAHASGRPLLLTPRLRSACVISSCPSVLCP